LVNAQGFNKKFDAQDFPMDVFKQMLDVNVYGVMLCCKHFSQHMIKNKYGKIINVSSVRGKIATKTPGNCGYCSTKGAVDMMTRQLASELGQYGITVNAFGPTVTETPMMTAMIESRGGDTYRKQLADGLPMRKMAVPEDCVGTAVYLASSASDFVTGNIVYPDGGLTAIG
jgi:gluconate 5-dehydrogenase